MGAKYSIVVPTRNRPNDLDRCLGRLHQQIQTNSHGDFQLIVSDDSLTNATQQLVESSFPTVIYTKGPRKGPGANRNQGASQAEGRWLIFLDDDCIPCDDFLVAYKRAIEAADSLGRQLLSGPTLRAERLPSLLWESPHDPDVGNITANFAITSKLFKSAGQIDERYQYSFEDVEFFERLSQLGHRTQMVPSAIAIHPIRRIPNARSLANRWEGRVIYALDRGMSPADIMRRLPWHMLRVIQSRFRGKSVSLGNLIAVGVFSCEWIYAAVLLPGWVRKWMRALRSGFWESLGDTSEQIQIF